MARINVNLIIVNVFLMLLFHSCINKTKIIGVDDDIKLHYTIDSLLPINQLDVDYIYLKSLYVIYNNKDTVRFQDTLYCSSCIIKDTCIQDTNSFYCSLQSKFIKIDKRMKAVSERNFDIIKPYSGRKFNKYSLLKFRKFLILSRGLDLYIIPESFDTLYNVSNYLYSIKDPLKLYPNLTTYSFQIVNDTLAIKTNYIWEDGCGGYFINKLYLPFEENEIDFDFDFPVHKKVPVMR